MGQVGLLATWLVVADCAAGETSLTILASFAGADGNFPEAKLVQGQDGNLYGTTHFGGTNNPPGAPGSFGYGNVFRLASDGTLSSVTHFGRTNGSQPMAGLIQDGEGNLYGTTHGEFPTSSYLGTIFRITTNGNLTTLVHFNSLNGAGPQGALVMGEDGSFYGTTSRGGTNCDCGTVFRMTSGGALTTLASFNRTNGAGPASRLVQGQDNHFYGTTFKGGIQTDYGTVFRVTTNGVLTPIFSFSVTNGAYPFAGLIQTSNGDLYGTTRDGGLNGNHGTVFKITTNGVLTTLVDFGGTNGSKPYAELVQGSDGNFYGTTSLGGANNLGTVFVMTPAGELRTLVSFAGTNGAKPYAGLLQTADGSFCGTTANGGDAGRGTIFRFPMPIVILSAGSVANNFSFTWNAVTERTYQIQYNPGMGPTNWQNLGDAQIATNQMMTMTDDIGTNSHRFYRVLGFR